VPRLDQSLAEISKVDALPTPIGLTPIS